MNPTTSADALGQMQQFQSSEQSPTDIQASQERQLGIPGAEQQVSGLRQAITNTTNLLQNVRPSIEGRTANSLVTSAQAEHQIANESAPISKTLADQTTKEGQSEADLSNLRSRASQNTALQLQGQDSKMSFLKSVYDALFGKEQAQAQAAQAAADQAEKVREFNASQDQSNAQFGATQSLEQQKLAAQIAQNSAGNNLEQQKINLSGASNVNPPQEFLNYISGQYKAAGKNPSRQTQDAWANAWFAQNKVPVSARQAYWDLFNSSYNRPANPQKDYLYAR